MKARTSEQHTAAADYHQRAAKMYPQSEGEHLQAAKAHATAARKLKAADRPYTARKSEVHSAVNASAHARDMSSHAETY